MRLRCKRQRVIRSDSRVHSLLLATALAQGFASRAIEPTRPSRAASPKNDVSIRHNSAHSGVAHNITERTIPFRTETHARPSGQHTWQPRPAAPEQTFPFRATRHTWPLRTAASKIRSLPQQLGTLCRHTQLHRNRRFPPEQFGTLGRHAQLHPNYVSLPNNSAHSAATPSCIGTDVSLPSNSAHLAATRSCIRTTFPSRATRHTPPPHPAASEPTFPS